MTSRPAGDHREICSTCGNTIEWGEKVVAVRYGRIHSTINHTAVSKDMVDYFHQKCEKAFRETVV